MNNLNTNILFIGGYYPKALEDLFFKKTKTGLDFAAHNLQEAIFKGFDQNKLNYQILNTPFLGSFPPYNKLLFVPKYCSEDKKVKSISYVNLSYFKRWNIKKKIKTNVYEWCKNTKGEKVLLFYNFSAIGIINAIRKDFQTTKIILLVTDLPEFMASNNSFFTRINKKIDNFLGTNIVKSLDNVDGYVLLTEHMTERLPIRDKPWMVMEGIYNTNDNVTNVPKEPYKTILYTGNLGKRYGILDLLEAFTKIEKQNYRLWIRGNGECLKEINEAANKDKRILYFDQLSRTELIKLQKRATVLINPVHSHEEFTKFFFPSKTMEYMASGTPTLMSKLPCLPKEYEPYIYFFDDESVEGMKNKMIEICEKSQEELNEFGKKAAEFIHAQKNPFQQCIKIADFINSVM
jgi:glycosyltransferase involved in cell wall biosynthesis